jgi:hypothetical protein
VGEQGNAQVYCRGVGLHDRIACSAREPIQKYCRYHRAIDLLWMSVNLCAYSRMAIGFPAAMALARITSTGTLINPVFHLSDEWRFS